MWQRLKRIFRSIMGWFIDLAEDPELILKQNIRDLQDQIPQMNEQVAMVKAQVTLAEMSPEDWDQVMAANLRSAFLCTKAVLPIFAKKPGGRVVLTSSITGPVTGFPGWAHYGASKAGQPAEE